MQFFDNSSVPQTPHWLHEGLRLDFSEDSEERLHDWQENEAVPTNIVQLLVTFIQLYSLVLLARIILSWVPNVDRSNQIIRFLYQATDPVLEPVRRVIPPIGMIDISPIVVLVGLQILQRVLVSMVAGV